MRNIITFDQMLFDLHLRITDSIDIQCLSHSECVRFIEILKSKKNFVNRINENSIYYDQVVDICIFYSENKKHFVFIVLPYSKSADFIQCKIGSNEFYRMWVILQQETFKLEQILFDLYLGVRESVKIRFMNHEQLIRHIGIFEREYRFINETNMNNVFFQNADRLVVFGKNYKVGRKNFTFISSSIGGFDDYTQIGDNEFIRP